MASLLPMLIIFTTVIAAVNFFYLCHINWKCSRAALQWTVCRPLLKGAFHHHHIFYRTIVGLLSFGETRYKIVLRNDETRWLELVISWNTIKRKMLVTHPALKGVYTNFSPGKHCQRLRFVEKWCGQSEVFLLAWACWITSPKHNFLIDVVSPPDS